MDQPQTLSIVLINPRLPLLVQSIDAFKDKRPEPVVVVPTVEEATVRAQTGLPCVLIFSIVEDADVIACIQMCKTLSLERRDGIHRLIVVSIKDNKKLQDSVLNRGASEFVNSKTAPSGLVFKTTRLLAQIQRHLDKGGDQKVVMSGQSRAAASPGMVIVKGPTFNVTDEVIAEDTWLVKATPPKKLGVRWAVETEGPDPDSGSWEPIGENAQGEEQWAWHTFDDNGKPYPAEAKQNFWIFVGQRPSYDLESEKWKLISAQPELFYYSAKTKGSSKFKLDTEKGLVFAQDNPLAAERIGKSKAIGAKVRQERMQQAANKTNMNAGQTSTASSPSAKFSGSAEEGIIPEYNAVDSVGVLRATQKEVPLDRVPCEEFGNPEGNWEPVKQQGWAFVTPEIRARGLAGLPKLAPFWMLDKKQSGTKPYFDSDSGSWLFEKTQMPRKVEKFDDLPAVYQDFLNTAAQSPVHIDKAKANAELALKQEGERTSQKFESIRDAKADPDRPHKTPLNYFFKMSLLANSGLDSAELVSHIASNVGTIVPIESITLLKPSTEGDKSKAIVAYSTSDRLKEGRVLELEKLPFKEALTDFEARNIEVTKELCVSTYPILGADGSSILGCVLLFYSKVNQSHVVGKRSFIEKVMKQLSRIYQTAA